MRGYCRRKLQLRCTWKAPDIQQQNNFPYIHVWKQWWKDLLTAVDGVTLTYDEIGNPLTYYNGQSYSLNWTEGRKLATITTGGKTTGYLYDANGNRIKNTNSDGSYIIYVNANGVSLGEKHYSADGELTKTLRYIYDENGSVCGYIASADGSTTMYYFIKNLQGDVIRVYRVSDKAIVATYSYDSWGNITSATGEVAEENPFRYRGYYYDSETGFYYVSSRYYDSKIGRFINADTTDILGVSGNLYDKNLYAYCDNNPVVRKDYTGAIWDTALDVVSLGVSIIDVVNNPNDAEAWIGLAVDAICLALPFVTGGGLLVKAIAKSDDTVDALKTIKKAATTLNKGENTVYVAYSGKKLEYVGITNDFNRRKNEWKKVRTIQEYVTDVDREGARFIEQAVIDTFGMKNNGGILTNKINSIGRKNPIRSKYEGFFSGMLK